MRKIVSPVCALAMIGAASLAANIGLPVAASHAQASSASPSMYLASLFAGRNGNTVTGAIALLSSSAGGATSPASGSTATSAATGMGFPGLAMQVSGLRPNGTYHLVFGAHACSTNASNAGGAGTGGTGNSGTGTGGTGASSSTIAGGQLSASLPAIKPNALGDAMLIAALPTRTALPAGFQVGLIQGASGNTIVACANLHQPTRVVSLSSMGHGTSRGLAMITEHVPVMNNTIRDGTEVIVYATGLQAKLAQPEHIHAGPCNTTSAVLVPLADLVGDAGGRAVAGTGIPLPMTLSSGSIHIHRVDYSMQACGNLAGNNGTMTTPAASTSGSATPVPSATPRS